MEKPSVQALLLFDKDPIDIPWKEINSICIDKDNLAQAILRILLETNKISISEDLIIHGGYRKDKEGNIYYYFLNEQQNKLISQSEACSNL
jgi:hypothetical protein